MYRHHRNGYRLINYSDSHNTIGVDWYGRVVDWYSGLTSRLGLRLGGGAAGSIPRSAFVFCGGENVCVRSLCMGVGVHTAL